MTYEVQQNRWDQLIRRASGSIGPGSRVAETIAELFPMFDVENMPAELLFLSGTKIAMGASLLGASVAENNHHQLFNPADSGHLLTLTDVYLSTVTASGVMLWEASLASAPLTTDVGNNPLRDTRLGVAQLPVGQIRNDQSAGGVATQLSFRVENPPFHIQPKNSIAVLFPGTGITFVSEIVNFDSSVSFFWRERAFLQSEEL